MSKHQATQPIQRPHLRLFLMSLLLGLSGLAFSGCEKQDSSIEEATVTNENGETVPAEEVIQDSVYIVTEKRQSGGNMIPGDVSSFDGKPRMKRAPLEHMIIVRGDQTGQETAYLLPQNDFFVVKEGHRLQKSTLAKWESTTPDHIPPPPPPSTENNRSRAGGADGNLVF